MIIGKYKVEWVSVGWSYAQPIVYVRASFFGLFNYWKKVWEGPSKNYIRASKLHKLEMAIWFKDAIAEYEAYQKSWK